jgi:transglutaminase-like putative cysteine protease
MQSQTRLTDILMLLRIDHETRLTYTAPISDAVSEVRTAPPSQDDQTVLAYRLRVTPSTPVTGYRDGFGNRVELFNLLMPHAEVVITSAACVRVHRRPASEVVAIVPFTPDLAGHVDALEYIRSSPQVDFAGPVREFATGIPIASNASVEQVAEAVMAAVRDRLVYEKRVTEASTRVSESLELGRGVCQDFAHLFIAASRLRGLPSRYVSGYVHQPGEIATHAWAQVWAGPELGWVNIDPTHGRWVGSEHVVTAVGRDYSDVAPNRGVWKGTADEAITVTVSVRPVDRVPVDLAEPAATGWFSTSSSPGMASSGPDSGPSRQTRAKAFRQQQSQQQQTRGCRTQFSRLSECL